MGFLPRFYGLLRCFQARRGNPLVLQFHLQLCLILSLYAKPPQVQASSLLALPPREQRGTSRFVRGNYKPQESVHQKRRSGEAAAKLQVP